MVAIGYSPPRFIDAACLLVPVNYMATQSLLVCRFVAGGSGPDGRGFRTEGRLRPDPSPHQQWSTIVLEAVARMQYFFRVR
jgi:hypothetical protein